MSQKPTPKMCKSPKSSNYQNAKPVIDKMVDYETLNTTCTVVGSNNLHLVKKPQMLTAASPVYSNPSPGYPQSPYSSPASLKSPSPSLKPPTPQPSFPVMQIIHNNTLLARPIQSTQPQNIIKLKPHLNILPKPSASPQPPPKPSVSPQIVIPTNQQATIVPTAPPLLLNQMPMITPGVQFIIRPQTAKISAQMPTAAPQGLILQPSGQQLLQIQPPRSQPMVRVLTNGVQLGQPTTTYVTTTHLAGQPQHNNMGNVDHQSGSSPKKKPKKKKQKLDLANIMKLSGIGDEDDIQFESDTSQSESDTNTVVPGVPVIQHSSDTTKKMSNIQISAVTAQPTINATATPLLQVLNQNFQGGVLSNATAAQPQAQAGLPFSPFITPNFTINNGLMLQRSSGGFKLTMGEDGRLVLQHDPTLNQDLQSQLLLQSIFGLNGGLVLQPSIDQQVHSQTVQTIQQQSVQTIQQQTVQSQTIQTVQQQTVQPHSLQTIQQTIQPQIQPQTVQQTVQQTIQHQTVQSQPISSLQQHAQPVQLVQPQQQLHNLQSQIQNLLQQQPLQGLQQRGQTQQNQPVLKVQPFQKNQQPPVHAGKMKSKLCFLFCSLLFVTATLGSEKSHGKSVAKQRAVAAHNKVGVRSHPLLGQKRDNDCYVVCASVPYFPGGPIITGPGPVILPTTEPSSGEPGGSGSSSDSGSDDSDEDRAGGHFKQHSRSKAAKGRRLHAISKSAHGAKQRLLKAAASAKTV